MTTGQNGRSTCSFCAGLSITISPSCPEASVTGTAYPKTSWRPRPSTPSWQGPPDLWSNQLPVVVFSPFISCLVLRTSDLIKWQNNRHNDSGHFPGRRSCIRRLTRKSRSRAAEDGQINSLTRSDIFISCGTVDRNHFHLKPTLLLLQVTPLQIYLHDV